MAKSEWLGSLYGIKVKNPMAPAVRREAKEEWGC
jgi:hypothetical protein